MENEGCQGCVCDCHEEELTEKDYVPTRRERVVKILTSFVNNKFVWYVAGLIDAVLVGVALYFMWR